MNFARMAAAATVLSLTLGVTGTFAADASVPGNIMGCLNMSKKAREALSANQQSPNVDAARAEMNLGRDYCSAQMYQKGVNSYAKALQLLGAG